VLHNDDDDSGNDDGDDGDDDDCDMLQVSNFEYFLAVGSHYPRLHTNMHWAFTIAGDKCSPCTSLEALLG
jgi:hypothetical protein